MVDVLAFRDRVRNRLMRLYDAIESGEKVINRQIARVLQMTIEHEAFHVEVRFLLLYFSIFGPALDCGVIFTETTSRVRKL